MGLAACRSPCRADRFFGARLSITSTPLAGPDQDTPGTHLDALTHVGKIDKVCDHVIFGPRCNSRAAFLFSFLIRGMEEKKKRARADITVSDDVHN